MAYKSDDELQLVGRLHYLTDIFIEIPAFSGVVITGLMMIDVELLSGLYLLKIVLGSLAVLVNAACLVPVLRRWFALEAGDETKARGQSRFIHLAFVIGLPAGLGALVIGLHRLGMF